MCLHTIEINWSVIFIVVSDLADILDLLKRHGYDGVSFHELGLFMGLLYPTLTVIEAKYKDDVKRCLEQCLVEWLNQADDVQARGGPILHSLLAALRKTKNRSAADKIDNESK